MTLFGYGNTNKAIAKKYAGRCVVFDDKFKDVGVDEWGNRLLPTHLFGPEASSLEIVTPGIPPHHPLVKSAKNLKSEYDFFAPKTPYSIWISGTNGKTTTTEMTGLLLKSRGAAVGGNIGTPLAKMDENAPIWVLETSSFQMHYTEIASPNLYVLLPVSDDHATWHGDFSEYEKVKLKPLSTMREGEMAIIPKKYEHIETNAFKVCYEVSSDLATYFGIEGSKIVHKEPFLMDALMALAVSKALFDEIDYELINSFKIGAHKIEEFLDANGRLWVDDSKATNIDAAIEAIKRYSDKKILLILGGDDKGADLTLLFQFMSGKNIEIFAIGSNTDKLFDLSCAFGLVCHKCLYLDTAVSEMAKIHNKNSIALLSPAAASLDQFSGYKERGDKFKMEVNGIL